MTEKFNPKITLIGSGMIGTTIGLVAGLQELTNNLVYLDVIPDMPMGKALDLNQAMAAIDMNLVTRGFSDISANCELMKDSDVVIVTAGFPRKPGMSRDDLLEKNSEVICNVGRAIQKQCSNAFVICITNPLDIMVSLLQKTSGIPARRVVGMGGMLDSSRFRYFLADELKINVRDIQTCVMGGHGNEMVPLVSCTSVSGVPLSTFIQTGVISEEKVGEIIQRTRNGGGEIVGLLKMGSAFMGPAVCAVEMAKAYLKNDRRLVSCCVQLNGEYGYKGVYAGVQCIIGINGVEKILELPLNPKESDCFKRSMDAVIELRDACRKLGFDA